MTDYLLSPHVSDDRLDDYADGLLEASDFEAAHAHVAGCAACAARLAELRALLAVSAAERRAVEPPAELWPLVVASTIERRRLQRQVLRSLRTPLLVAAVVLIALTSATTASVVRRIAAAGRDANVAVPSLPPILEEDAALDRALATPDEARDPAAQARIGELRRRLAAVDARVRGATDDEALLQALAERERVTKEIRLVLHRAPRAPRAPTPPAPPAAGRS